MKFYQEEINNLEKKKYDIYTSFIEGNTSLEEYIQHIENIDEKIRIIQKSEQWLKKPEITLKPKKKNSLTWFQRLMFLTTIIVIMLSIVVWAANQNPVEQDHYEPVQETVVNNPETAIELQADKFSVIPSPEETEWKSLGIFTTSGYCKEDYPHICNDGNPHTTALGTTPTVGRTIAVDPSVIPYGTEVMINNHIYIAEDCGTAIKGHRIDILYETHNEAYCHGMPQVEVFIKNN